MLKKLGKDAVTRSLMMGGMMVLAGVLALNYLFKIGFDEAFKIIATALVYGGTTLIAYSIITKIFNW